MSVIGILRLAERTGLCVELRTCSGQVFGPREVVDVDASGEWVRLQPQHAFDAPESSPRISRADIGSLVVHNAD
jgi:hypothetical protein